VVAFFEWMMTNKEWLFNGIGIAVIFTLLGVLIQKKVSDTNNNQTYVFNFEVNEKGIGAEKQKEVDDESMAKIPTSGEKVIFKPFSTEQKAYRHLAKKMKNCKEDISDLS
jgi:hypothetical protein